MSSPTTSRTDGASGASGPSSNGVIARRNGAIDHTKDEDSEDQQSNSASADEGSSQNNGSSGDDSDSGSSSDKGSSGDSSATPHNALEWTVLVLGVAIVLSVVGFLVYQIATGTDEVADVRVTLGEPQPASGGGLNIPITAENKGDRVAEAAVIEVCAGPDDCGEVSFGFIPHGSKREGFIGVGAPLAGPLKSRVVSYRSH